MNTSQLECFVQVAQNLSFRRAAEALHLSQPTVSKQVSSLEADLGGALFVRTTREVMLTSLGESFLQDATEILRLAYAAEERARRHAAGDGLVVAYSDGCELMRLAAALDMLRGRYGGLNVQLQQGPRDANVSLLAREQVDVVLGFETSSLVQGGVGFRRLIKSGLSCVLPAGSLLADRESVGPDDVVGMPQVVFVSPGARRRGVAAQAVLPVTDDAHTTRCATAAEAYALVDAGFGYALVPSIYTMPDPFHRVVAWQGRASAWYGAYHREGRAVGVVGEFLEAAREAFAGAGFDRPPGAGGYGC